MNGKRFPIRSQRHVSWNLLHVCNPLICKSSAPSIYNLHSFKFYKVTCFVGSTKYYTSDIASKLRLESAQAHLNGVSQKFI